MMLRMLMILAEYEGEMIVARTKDTLDRYKHQLDKKDYYITKDGKKKTSLGRPTGKKDGKKRRKSGYYQRWANK